MLIKTPCYQCYKESGILNPIKIELGDDCLYLVSCKKNHLSKVYIPKFKYEVLFERGIRMIMNGYYFESIAPLKSALERFHETYIKLIMLKNNISWSEICKFWKVISNKSEQQLGAFIAIYTHENFKSPFILDPKDDYFRNCTFHKGQLPSKNKAINFCNNIYSLIKEDVDKFKSKYPDHWYDLINELFRYELWSRYTKEAFIGVGTMDFETILQFSYPYHQDNNYDEYDKRLAKLKKEKEYKRSITEYITYNNDSPHGKIGGYSFRLNGILTTYIDHTM